MIRNKIGKLESIDCFIIHTSPFLKGVIENEWKGVTSGFKKNLKFLTKQLK